MIAENIKLRKNEEKISKTLKRRSKAYSGIKHTIV
jgi:hypothetical protein